MGEATVSRTGFERRVNDEAGRNRTWRTLLRFESLEFASILMHVVHFLCGRSV